MKPAPFKLHRPKTLDEAVAILADVADNGGLVLAGGQSLVPMMALRVAYPSDLVDINAIDALGLVRVEDNTLVIGATVRHSAFHAPVADGSLGRLLAKVSRHIAHHPIRMRGTFCGSLAHADPASEWCLVAATLDADIHLVNGIGTRIVPAREFFTGAMTTVREANELIFEARLPLLPAHASFGFYEFNRRAGDFALGMALATCELRDGRMANVRIGIGGIEETPRRLNTVEAVLEGKAPNEILFEAAGKAAAEAVDPLRDPLTSADYRRDLSAVVVRRALQAMGAGGSK